MSAAAVVEHLPLVRRVAGRIARRLPAHVQLDDLMSAGTEGLLDAARKFDPAKGVAFGAYAEIRIRGAVMDELRQHDFAPRALRRRQRLFESARQQAKRAGCPTTDEALARRVGVAPEALAGWLAEGQLRMLSTDAPDAAELLDEREDVEAGAVRKQQLAALQKAIETLTPRLQIVLSLYYAEELTLKEIGQTMGVTESRVCQLHGQAVAGIRAALQGQG